MSASLSRALGERLATKPIIVSSAAEFIDAARDAKTVSFLDSSTIAELDRLAKSLGSQPVPPPQWRKLVAAVSLGPVIAICSEPYQTTIGWFHHQQWLSHVVSAGMLEHPMITDHLTNVIQTLTSGTTPRLLDWVGEKVAGRRIRLTHASRRVPRLERMHEFFESKGVSARRLVLLSDAAEELLTNAFYDAPVAAGALKMPISRTQDVSLPDDSACDLAYGYRDELAIVRVRDPFGSLTRERLIEVLTRCARTEGKLELDDSMGGAGIGLWRVFSVASLVAISVVNNRHTEVLVGIAPYAAAAGPRPFAFHLFFKGGAVRRYWKLSDDSTGRPSLNSSVSIVVNK